MSWSLLLPLKILLSSLEGRKKEGVFSMESVL